MVRRRNQQASPELTDAQMEWFVMPLRRFCYGWPSEVSDAWPHLHPFEGPEEIERLWRANEDNIRRAFYGLHGRKMQEGDMYMLPEGGPAGP